MAFANKRGRPPVRAAAGFRFQRGPCQILKFAPHLSQVAAGISGTDRLYLSPWHAAFRQSSPSCT
ncbi:hypothetical protein DSL92_04150 [Billgrantia gudaonensis]|uniref:Uncharacterized protein n=1 Tax=Billgrantia gudaonensis TaxID=376427 RepID=A0A432JKG4_9GAMM|nr:hypothetical protein DSL92_04150 [Halomonas gudaonensis]